MTLCLDRKSGKTLWRKTVTKGIPHEGTHRDNNYASASPTTDGERLYCWFGSSGLYCYDLEGKKLWERNLGKVYMGASLGEGSSPVVHDGKLILIRDHQRQSYIEVLNARDGKTLWKKIAIPVTDGPPRQLSNTRAKLRLSPPPRDRDEMANLSLWEK